MVSSIALVELQPDPCDLVLGLPPPFLFVPGWDRALYPFTKGTVPELGLRLNRSLTGSLAASFFF